MSGFTMRRFVLQNISAVASHCPLPAVSRAALAVTSANGATVSSSSSSSPVERFVYSLLGGASSGSKGFSLMTEDEMQWVRQRKKDDAEESRIVFSTRPTRSIVRGVCGACLNVVVSCAFSPLVFLSMTLERIRMASGPSGLVTGPAFGVFWGGLFLSTGLYAAAQQLLLSVYYGLVAGPLHLLRNCRPPLDGTPSRIRSAYIWSPLSCRYEAPSGAPHPLLAYADTDAAIHEAGQRRHVQRTKRDGSTQSSKKAQYQGRRGAKSVADDDYYGLLGVERSATTREIKEAYNKLVLECHPDRNPHPGAAEQFDTLTKAYRVLTNAEKRKKFDIGGTSIVEDTGEKKREGVHALFGGDELIRLSGDVFMGAFSRRVIDGVDNTDGEIAVIFQRMYEACREELLTKYLSLYTSNASSSSEQSGDGSGTWNRTALREQLRKVSGTGLGKEVLFAIGTEYQRVITYYDAEQASSLFPLVAARRVSLYATEIAPTRCRQFMDRAKIISSIRTTTFKNTEAMVDLAWYTSVSDLQRTARWVAMSVLYDVSINSSERSRRRDALASLSATFIQQGQAYKGANKATMDQLMSSLREYQHQKQRGKQ